MSKVYYAIGIDPGVDTGIGVWNIATQKLDVVCSKNIVAAMEFVFTAICERHMILIRIEDARLRKWFGNSGREKLQGAGSVKRDSAIWEEFCKYYRFQYELVAPSNNTTKLDSDSFKRITKWEERTNQHGRDAACLVIGMK